MVLFRLTCNVQVPKPVVRLVWGVVLVLVVVVVLVRYGATVRFAIG